MRREELIRNKADLEPEVRRCLTDKPKWSPDMDLHYNVPSIVWCRVQHLVKSETSYLAFSTYLTKMREGRTIVNDVVNLPILPRNMLLMSSGNVGDIVTYCTVASTIFLGKSSAPTSPATPSASPPAALTSSTTDASRFSSILHRSHLV